MFNKLAALAFALTLAAPGLLLAATPVNINQATQPPSPSRWMASASPGPRPSWIGAPRRAVQEGR
jgi:hypothetical protein